MAPVTSARLAQERKILLLALARDPRPGTGGLLLPAVRLMVTLTLTSTSALVCYCTRRTLWPNWRSQYNTDRCARQGAVAQLGSHAGHLEQAAELPGLALRHPASNSEVESTAQLVLEALRAELGPEEMQAALARRAEMDLEQVMEQILAEG